MYTCVWRDGQKAAPRPVLMGGFPCLGFDLPLPPKAVVLNLSSFLEVLGKGPRAFLSFEMPGLPRLRFEDREAEENISGVPCRFSLCFQGEKGDWMEPEPLASEPGMWSL